MPLVDATEQDRQFMRIALAEAEQAYARGGIPVGGAMVRDGMVIATGRNRSLETNDPTSHGETDCIRSAGLLPDWSGVTLYTTLSPCLMCSGAMLFLGIPRLVIGERETFLGDVGFLVERGLEVAVLDDPACVALMRRYIDENPEVWARITAAARG